MLQLAHPRGAISIWDIATKPMFQYTHLRMRLMVAVVLGNGVTRASTHASLAGCDGMILAVAVTLEL